MNIREIYNSIDREKLESFVEEKKEENLYIDFKTTNNSELNSADDKKSFLKSLSGFANSSGGIVVWGIVARKNEDNIDCAQVISPIANVRRFMSRLHELTGEAISPLIDGVEHKIIPFDGNSGCAISLIPESSSGPHMALLGDNRYYKRSGDSFYVMEHFDLEDMFGRRKRPELKPTVEIERRGNPTYTTFKFGLLNTGRGVAKYANAIIKISSENGPIQVIEVEGSIVDQSKLNPGQLVFQWTENLSVLHPHVINYSIGSITISREILRTTCEIKITCIAEGSQQKTTVFNIPSLEF